MTVEAVFGGEIRETLRLLEDSLRDGEPLPEEFLSRMARLVELGDVEVLAAKDEERAVGVLVLAFRPNVSLGGDFASIEDLFVVRALRRRGIGRRLVEEAAEACRRRGVSYVEVHAEEDEARAFYERLGYEEEGEVRVFSRAYPLNDAR